MALENKLGLTSSADLAREEERLSKKKAVELFENGVLDTLPAGKFSTLQAIHKYLFEDIYDFAGELRTVNLAKGNFRFAPLIYLEAALANIDKMPQSTFDEIIEKYVEMNIAHPFREGNGRSARIWLDHILKTEIEILSDEKTLVLMDEPDAHLHEGRKPALCNMMREYPNRQIVIATHSPIMAQIANEKELLMLELENGKSTILTDEKIEKIKKLSGTSWDVIGQGMMLRSSRPLVVFEGKTDVMYVKRALEMLKSRVTDYASLNVDFLNANGAGNVKSFIDNLKAFVPDSKKIVVFFDRDNAGKDGVQAITGISKNDGRVAHYQDIVQDNITTSFIPYKDGVTEGDFLIEDYFSWDDTIKAIVEDVIPDRKHPIKMLPNLPDKIKKELEKRINKPLPKT